MQVPIVGLGSLKSVERALFLVIIAERVGQLAERVDQFATREDRTMPGNLGHQLVNIFELLECGPASIAGPPLRPRPQPYRKGLGEILIRVALRIPKPQVLNEVSARRIGTVVAWISPRAWPEQLLPA